MYLDRNIFRQKIDDRLGLNYTQKIWFYISDVECNAFFMIYVYDVDLNASNKLNIRYEIKTKTFVIIQVNHKLEVLLYRYKFYTIII